MTDDEGNDDTFLVTGATGTVGSPHVRELRDAPVPAATRSPGDTRSGSATTSSTPEFDLDRPGMWGPALAGVDLLFVFVPPAVGVDPVREFADAVARVGVEHVASLFILGAEKLPVLPHRRVEKHLVRSGMAATFLRASLFRAEPERNPPPGDRRAGRDIRLDGG